MWISLISKVFPKDISEIFLSIEKSMLWDLTIDILLKAYNSDNEKVTCKFYVNNIHIITLEVSSSDNE